MDVLTNTHSLTSGSMGPLCSDACTTEATLPRVTDRWDLRPSGAIVSKIYVHSVHHAPLSQTRGVGSRAAATRAVDLLTVNGEHLVTAGDDIARLRPPQDARVRLKDADEFFEPKELRLR